VLLTAAVIGVLGYQFLGPALNHKPKTPTDLGARPVGYAVETPNLRFTMPGAPTEEPVQSSSLGIDVTGTAWSVKTDDLMLQVLLMDFGSRLDENMAQAGFDSMVGGMARRSNGTIVTNEPFQTADGFGRRGKITLDGGGTIYFENRTSGGFVVSMLGASAGGAPPPEYTNLVDSFRFLQ
jgi:hypothetical protein